MAPRFELTLENKVELIRKSTGAKMSHRELAELFNCGKTQVANILKKKDEYLEMYERNVNGKRMRIFRSPELTELDELCKKWFDVARSGNVNVTGPMIQEQAKQYAANLGVANFKASNGWLQRFKWRHNIGQRAVCRKPTTGPDEAIADWKSRLPKMIDGYEPRDVWWFVKTGCLYRTVPSECESGGNLQLTIGFAVNSVGTESMKPIAIGTSIKPGCFENIDASNLPVHYYGDDNARMTDEIFADTIAKLDRKMTESDRKILMFLDGAQCHPGDTLNITFVYIPANITSELRPPVIQNFKRHYRKLLFRRIVSSADTRENAEKVLSGVNVLDAVYWISDAWNCISSSTVKKCFEHAGFPVASDIHDDRQLADDELGNLLRTLTSIRGLEGIGVCDFIRFDDETAEAGSGNDCAVDLVKKKAPGDIDGKNREPERKFGLATYHDCVLAFDEMKQFAARNGDEELFRELVKVEKIVQKKACSSKIDKVM